MTADARPGARLPLIAVGVAIGAQIAYPLVPAAHRGAASGVVVAVGALAALILAISSSGRARGVLITVAAAGIGFAADLCGVRTGIPFGRYDYGTALGVRVGGVPLIVAAAWAMLAWPAVLSAAALVRSRIGRVLVGGWALAAWDLYLDPQQVHFGFWSWRDPSPHLPGVPTVPLTNYAGWLATSIVISAAVVALAGDALDAERPAAGPCFVLYGWTFAASALALGAFYHLPAAAGWGAAGMGSVAIPLALRRRRRTAPPSAGRAPQQPPRFARHPVGR